MERKLKTKYEPKRKPFKKSAKKQKPDIPVSDDVLSETGHDSEVNECQTLPMAQKEENEAPGVRRGKIKLSETGKRRVKNEKPVAPIKQLRKPMKEKANLSPQKVPSDDGGNAPSRRPSTSSSQEYGSEMSAADLESNSENQYSRRDYRTESPKKNLKTSPKKGAARRSKNRSQSKSPHRKGNKDAEISHQNTKANKYNSEMSVADLENNSENGDHCRSYRSESPKKNLKTSPKKRIVRRSKTRSQSKSPHRKENKNAEINYQNADNKNESPQVEKNISSKQYDAKLHNRKKSPNKQRRIGNKRSRSPINFNREENDSNNPKLKKSKTDIRKRSPISPKKTKSPKKTRSNGNSGDKNSKVSSVDNKGISPKQRKQGKYDTPVKKHSAEKSKKLDRSPSRMSKGNRNEQRKNSPRGGTNKRHDRNKSPRPKFKTSRIHKASSKPKMSLKSHIGSVNRGKKTFLGKKFPPGSKTLPKKKALSRKRKSETRAKTKAKVRKSFRRRIMRRKSVKRVIIRRKSQKSNPRRKK